MHYNKQEHKRNNVHQTIAPSRRNIVRCETKVAIFVQLMSTLQSSKIFPKPKIKTCLVDNLSTYRQPITTPK